MCAGWRCVALRTDFEHPIDLIRRGVAREVDRRLKVTHLEAVRA